MTFYSGTVVAKGVLTGNNATIKVNAQDLVRENLNIAGDGSFTGTEADKITLTATVFVNGQSTVVSQVTRLSSRVSGNVNTPVDQTVTVSGQTIHVTETFQNGNTQIVATFSDIVHLSGFTGTISGGGTLNEVIPVISLNRALLNVNPNSRFATFQLTRGSIPPVDTGSTVEVVTQDGSAIAGTDYTGIDQIVTFKAGSATSAPLKISIPITSTGKIGPNLTFAVVLENPTDAKIGRGQATVTIVENVKPAAEVRFIGSANFKNVTTGHVVRITAVMNEPVVVSGKPTLSLSDGATAVYDADRSTASTLAFNYVVGAGNATADLQVTSINLPVGAVIRDRTGHDASLAVSRGDLGLHINTPIQMAQAMASFAAPSGGVSPPMTQTTSDLMSQGMLTPHH